MKDIIDFIKSYSFDKAYKWLLDIRFFYVKPKTFFNKLFFNSDRLFFQQLIFYSALYYLGFAIAFHDIEIRTIAWIASLDLLLPLLYLLPLALSHKLINGCYNWRNFMGFLLCSKMLFLPLFAVSHKLFLLSENYTFLFLANSLLALFIILTFIGSVWIFYNSIFRKISAVVLNVLVLNLLIIIPTTINFDFYSNEPAFISLSDPILAEYYDQMKDIKELNELPTTRAKVETIYGTQISFGIQSINDSASTSSPERNNEYKINIQRNIEKLDSLAPLARFNRTRELLVLWKDYFKEIQKEITYFPTSIKPEEITKEIPLIDTIHKVKFGRMQLMKIFNKSLYKYYFHINMRNNGLIENSEIAELPLSVVYGFFYPAFIVSDFFSTGEVKTFVNGVAID